MAKKRTREASSSLEMNEKREECFDVVESHGELGVGDEGGQLQREEIQRIHAQLAQREVHQLTQLLRRVRLTAALVGVDLGGSRKGKPLSNSERRRCEEANRR